MVCILYATRPVHRTIPAYSTRQREIALVEERRPSGPTLDVLCQARHIKLTLLKSHVSIMLVPLLIMSHIRQILSFGELHTWKSRIFVPGSFREVQMSEST